MPEGVTAVLEEQVGRFRMTVVRAETTPESAERWSMRTNMLAMWLLAEWDCEQKERKSA